VSLYVLSLGRLSSIASQSVEELSVFPHTDMASSESCKSSSIICYGDRRGRWCNVARPWSRGETTLQWPV